MCVCAHVHSPVGVQRPEKGVGCPGLSLILELGWWTASTRDPPVSPTHTRNTGMPHFLKRTWGFELRS